MKKIKQKTNITILGFFFIIRCIKYIVYIIVQFKYLYTHITIFSHMYIYVLWGALLIYNFINKSKYIYKQIYGHFSLYMKSAILYLLFTILYINTMYYSVYFQYKLNH